MRKENWPETKQRFLKWWKREGLVIGNVAPIFPKNAPKRIINAAEYRNYNPELQYADPEAAAAMELRIADAQEYPADCIPAARTEFGPGSLAMYLGSRPEFDPEQATVWFHSVYNSRDEFPELRFNPEAQWWQKSEALYRSLLKALGLGEDNSLIEKADPGPRLLTGFPDLVENWDILASLRGANELLIDMIEDPVWVKEKVGEISTVYFDVYDRLFDMTKAVNQGSVYGCFRLWSPGRCAKLQCDGSAMFSPAMFENIVLPSLEDQCRRLDHTLYHLDGTQCIPHLDLLLQIRELDAIEWTPQAGIERGAHPRWYPMYRCILDAGKSVQVLVYPEDVEKVPALLDAIGTEGVYLLCILERKDFYRLLKTASTWYTE